MSVSFNPFTGTFDFVGTSSGGSSADNFSYKTVALGITVEVPQYQQMIVMGGEIEVIGTLNIIGEVAVLA